MMPLDKFLKQMAYALTQPSKYMSSGWGKWDGSKWGWDCVCFIKGILWGWTGDTTKPRGGGAIYASNGVPDIGTDTLITKCKNVSKDFSTLEVGELVWMPGHVGVCLAPGKIIEASTGWNNDKLFLSDIDDKGNRTYQGKGGSNPWQKHGFLPYVDYTAKPTPKPEPVDTGFKVGDKVKPINLVNYTGKALKAYDKYYVITQITGDRAVCCAERGGKLIIWAAMNIKDIEKI